MALLAEEVAAVLARAKALAHETRSDLVGYEHLIVALLVDRNSATELLAQLDKKPRLLGEQVLAGMDRGRGVVEKGHRPYSTRFKLLLEAAMSEAHILGQEPARCSHLLLAALVVAEGNCARVFNDAALTVDLWRTALTSPNAA